MCINYANCGFLVWPGRTIFTIWSLVIGITLLSLRFITKTDNVVLLEYGSAAGLMRFLGFVNSSWRETSSKKKKKKVPRICMNAEI